MSFGYVLDLIRSCVGSVLTWIRYIIYSFYPGAPTQYIPYRGLLRQLLPLFAVPIAICILLVAIKIIKSITWGR